MSGPTKCAVRGVLHGGRAICGSVVNAELCGFSGACQHQRPAPCARCGGDGYDPDQSNTHHDSPRACEACHPFEYPEP